jgi:hypothetical protein
MGRLARNIALVTVALALAACSGVYRTYYSAAIDPAVSRNWRVVDVSVTVPESLVVSEAKTLVPRGDIVWREDPPGDRKAQVATVMRNAVMRGASSLHGPRRVVIQLQLLRFHALTFEAEGRLRDAGVHNIQYYATVVDVATGAVLAGPERIEADVPAFSGPQAVERRLNGETQRSVITNHVAETTAAWLGIGPDNRGTFTRAGD